MESYKYRLIKEFCDLDVNMDKLDAFLEYKKQNGEDVNKTYPHHIEQKNAMLDYSKALANRLVNEGILSEFMDEVRKSINIDAEEEKSVEESQEELNKAFEEAVVKSIKECFGMDVKVDIKSL